MKTFIKAARPKTLIASISPILIGTVLAIKGGHFHFWIFLFTLLTGVGIQISTNFANDLFDYLKGADTEQRKGPVRVTASGLLSISQMKALTTLVMGCTALCSVVLIVQGGMVIGGLVALALLLALGYTAGPFPLAYLGLAEFFILVFFGPVATLSTYFLQTGQLSFAAFLAGLAPGLLSCSLLILNNLRDIEEDRLASKKTLVARFGKRFGKGEFAISIILALCVPLFFLHHRSLMLLCLACIVPGLALVKDTFKTDSPYAYIPLFGKTGRLLSLYTLTFCAAYLL